jgi:adenylate cyclase
VQPVPPSPEDIRAQLDRVLSSGAFSNSIRLQRFLRYVVERSLAGEGDGLKEYSIGTSVFDRDEQYDPRIDSIVRVEAGRLRSKLDEYYKDAGVSDGVIIRIPRGTYAPVFERREMPAQPAVSAALERGRMSGKWRTAIALVIVIGVLTAIAAWRSAAGSRPAPTLTVAVLPFANYSTNTGDRLLAARLTDGVTGELARIGTLGVVSHTSALQFEGARRPLKEIAKALNADMVVEASVDVRGDAVSVQVRLVDALVDRKSFVQEIEGSLSALPELQRRVAQAIDADVSSRRVR